jgi:hypothetical protein
VTNFHSFRPSAAQFVNASANMSVQAEHEQASSRQFLLVRGFFFRSRKSQTFRGFAMLSASFRNPGAPEGSSL